VRGQARNHLEDLPVSQHGHRDLPANRPLDERSSSTTSHPIDGTRVHAAQRLIGSWQWRDDLDGAVAMRQPTTSKCRQLAAWLGLVPGQYSSGADTSGASRRLATPIRSCWCLCTSRAHAAPTDDSLSAGRSDCASAEVLEGVMDRGKNARMAWRCSQGEPSTAGGPID